MKSIFKKSLILVSIFFTVILSGCIKGEFDKPPTDFPEISKDQIISFDKLFEKLKTTAVTPIQEEKYIEALVVADDKSGNFYKTLIIKDINGELGLSVSIDDYNLNVNYPVGQQVFIFLKDLTIGYYEGLPTLGINETNKVGRIPAAIYKKVILKGKSGLTVEPLKVNITDLNSKHFNRLIQLDGMQFKTATSTTTYADPNPASPLTINHTLTNCANKEIVLRNSGFADFAGDIVPSGNGSIVCVYSYFRNAAQLFIRDVTDVSFTEERCGGGGPSGTQISIENLRSQYTGAAKDLTTGFVKGIVISDIVNKNINGQNIVVQDGDYGILLRFKTAVNIPLGTEVKVGLAGGQLSEFSKLLQVQNLVSTNVEVLSSGKTVTPKILTVSQIDISKHESTLIKIVNATVTGGTKYSDGTVKVKDATGEVQLYTLSAATFASTPIKTGIVSVTAIASEFTSGKQLTIRNTNDVEGGSACDVTVATDDCDGDGVPNGQDCAPLNPAIYPGAPCDDGNPNTTNDKYDAQCICAGTVAGSGINETFSSLANNADVVLSGWVNAVVKGTRKWQAKLFSGNTYAQATAFNDTAPEMETWLITPEIQTSVTPTLTFETAKAFWVHDGLSVWVTTNYTGDPATTTWTKVTAKIAVKDDADNTFIPSGNVNLQSFGPNVRIGFKYEGTSAKNTSTYRVDNVKIQ
jgi:hypothetical protein